MYVFRNLEEWRQAFLREKERLRRALAQLPFEEKVRRLRRLQQLVATIQQHRTQVRERLRHQRPQQSPCKESGVPSGDATD